MIRVFPRQVVIPIQAILQISIVCSIIMHLISSQSLKLFNIFFAQIGSIQKKQSFLALYFENMNDREKRLKSIQSELCEIYGDLFGVPYKLTGDVDEGTQFKTILGRFRDKHFAIRQRQKDRSKKEKKGNAKLTQQLLLNQKIREEIKMCENLLKEAHERIKNGIKNQDKSKYEKVLKSRISLLDECYQMLNNIINVQYGDNFETKKQHQTLNQFKKRIKEDDNNEINLQQQEALERFKRRDEDIDNIIDQVRKVDKQFKNQLRTANQNIKITQDMIENNMNIATRVEIKIQKGNTDLRQVLKQYRRPSKLCLDVILILLLLGLVGVIINMFTGTV